MNLQIKKATRKESKLKIALIGISGSGKTYSALAIAKGLGQKVLVVDSEHGSAAKYAQFDFDIAELNDFHPQNYIDYILYAEQNGYDVVVLDSLSHAWVGKGGALDIADAETKRSKSGNSYMAWCNVSPIQNSLIDTILQSRVHVIATMRAKTEYVQEKDERTGRTAPRKVGMAPVQRDGMEYEFDIVGELTQEHDLIVSKSRCSAIDGGIIHKPGAEFAATLLSWLNEGVPQRETYDVAAMTLDELKAVGRELAENDSNHPQLNAIAAEARKQKAVKAAQEVKANAEPVE